MRVGIEVRQNRRASFSAFTQLPSSSTPNRVAALIVVADLRAAECRGGGLRVGRRRRHRDVQERVLGRSGSPCAPAAAIDADVPAVELHRRHTRRVAPCIRPANPPRMRSAAARYARSKMREVTSSSVGPCSRLSTDGARFVYADRRRTTRYRSWRVRRCAPMCLQPSSIIVANAACLQTATRQRRWSNAR